MRAMFGVVGLLVTLAIVAVLAKKQMGVLTPTVTATPPGITAPAPGATPQQQSQQIQKQVAETVEKSMQQERPMPEDK